MKKSTKGLTIYIIIFGVIILSAFLYYGQPRAQITEIPFSTFVKEAASTNISELHYRGTVISGKLKGSQSESFIAYAPSLVELSIIDEKYIIPQVEGGQIRQFTGEKPQEVPFIVEMLPTIIMVGILIIFFFVFMGNAGGGGGKVMSFGKSRAKLHKEDDQKKITFKEVAGLDEEKEELEEIVDFLKHPDKYIALGARIPKGMLLVGPPGTGKTYISRAAAGEAGVPFYSISGSDFVEMFVGVGASRVRDLFEQAKKNSPCIVFIDEIDAVGRRRGAGLGGGHDEREQTLNQLLVEMDGFGENQGIIILAATNRPDILDPALLRPGRFDRQVVIGSPDIKGREAIFEVHSKNKPLAKDVNPQILARRTPGFTPADIENMLNEAALLTARKNRKRISMDIVEEAITKVIAGPEKKSRVISDEERKLTAYHEAGHALVAYLLPHSDPVHQITIIPRGRMGGFTMTLPKEEKYFTTKTEMEERILHLLGGRVAEKLVLEDISTGASNDLQRATTIAKDMITRYGMSDKLGPVNYGESDEVFLGRDFSSRRNYSEELASEIDNEIRRMLEEAFDNTEKLLKENLDKLQLIAETLLDIETLDADQFLALMEGREMPEHKVYVPSDDEDEEKTDDDAEDEEKADEDADDEEKDGEETDEDAETEDTDDEIEDEDDVENVCDADEDSAAAAEIDSDNAEDIKK